GTDFFRPGGVRIAPAPARTGARRGGDTCFIQAARSVERRPLANSVPSDVGSTPLQFVEPTDVARQRQTDRQTTAQPTFKVRWAARIRRRYALFSRPARAHERALR